MRCAFACLGFFAAVFAGCAGAGPGASPSGAEASLSNSALVGTWQTEITKADIAAGGVTDIGVQNENSGRFTWTFAADGTWTTIQESLDGSPINSPVFRGTWSVNGGSLVAITEFPTEYKDAGLHYTWSIDGAAVRFTLLDPPDPVLPLVVASHPWRRVS